MKSIQAALTRKFGPLPAWTWAGIVGVGIIIWRRRMGSGTTTPTGTAADIQGVGPYGQSPYDISGGGYSSGGGGGYDTGGGAAGASGGATGIPSNPAPTINVLPPDTGTSGVTTRTAKTKQQHNAKTRKHGRTKTKRSDATHKPTGGARARILRASAKRPTERVHYTGPGKTVPTAKQKEPAQKKRPAAKRKRTRR